jgi:transcriptional regulator with XRE-family HTH domain
MPSNQGIGRKIAEARRRKGWTQLQFALEANVSPSSVQRWEAGRLPSVRELVRIANLLNVPAEELLGDDATQRARLVALDERLAVVESELRELRQLLLKLLDAHGPHPGSL